MKQQKNLKNDEQGIVSMIIVIIVMLLLTLIVLAMSRNANREQRQALDRQLSNQAYYAAESGINDAVDYVAKNSNEPGFSTIKDGCGALSNDYDPEINPEGPVKYTCVMYNTEPDNLQYTVQEDKSEIIPIQPSNGGLKELTISWEQHEGSGDFSGCSEDTASFPNVNDYNTQACSAGVLRVDLIDPNSGLDRATLAENNFVAFFVPGGGSSTSTISRGAALGDKGGRVIAADCSDGTKCQVTITGLSLSANNRMYLKVRSVYTENNVTITGVDDDGAIKFEQAQMMVDSTGKANDVLKRLQVRVPLKSKVPYPEFAIQTADSICKRITVSSPTDVNVENPPCRTPQN